MSDLIHANELLEELEEWYADLYDTNPKRQLGVNDAIVIACQMPTVDAIPIEWIESQVDKGKWAELVQRWAERRKE